MNKKQMARLAMQETVIQLFTDKEPLWTDKTPVVTALNQVKSLTTDLKTFSTQQVKGKTPGKTTDKNQQELAFIEELHEMIKSIRPYAKTLENNALLYDVDYTKSELKRLKDEELRATAEVIADRAEEFKTDLADYGVTPALITSLKQGLTALTPAGTEPRQAGNERQRATGRLPEVLKDAKKQLLILDDLVPRLVKNEEFTTLYKLARKVRNTGGGGKGDEAAAPGGGGAPGSGV